MVQFFPFIEVKSASKDLWRKIDVFTRALSEEMQGRLFKGDESSVTSEFVLLWLVWQEGEGGCVDEPEYLRH